MIKHRRRSALDPQRPGGSAANSCRPFARALGGGAEVGEVIIPELPPTGSMSGR
jgi:hypothetical protein